ncbi:YtxH domain-containing protein [Magnetospirillum sulfuroxidans]|uniref:YtxH domain-containing protein n=1 Tax=Magnetospirillum sulfuroxidans TaxID=611300 RepID=A0ABS5IFW7_9PROT|nr:YtxH domain-containing protein [Magnetospirillum sulfuroxidans]MBR9973318.1 YtxH domain-containing protein [Magnetospirillum sulfuroxidans]
MAKKNKQKKAKGLKRRDLEQMMALHLGQGRNQGMLGGLGRLLPAGRSEQFLLGLLLGGAAAYVLSDAELRGKLFKAGIKAYGGLMGGMAEMQEQMADLQAEVQAEQNGQI